MEHVISLFGPLFFFADFYGGVYLYLGIATFRYVLNKLVNEGTCLKTPRRSTSQDHPKKSDGSLQSKGIEYLHTYRIMIPYVYTYIYIICMGQYIYIYIHVSIHVLR